MRTWWANERNVYGDEIYNPGEKEVTTYQVVPSHPEHVYLSTACHHELCKTKQCRLTCKFCPAKCVCQCHV